MLQNIPNEKILEIVRQGPTFPAKVAKALGGGGDTMLIGAILSTLISSGDLKVSTLKVGGSPLYYIPEQESKLEDFINYLNEKDKKTFKLIKEVKVLQDSTQDPLTRVSLRAIKDFAKQFEIEYKGQKILCWRFYSLSLEEAQALAKKILSEVKPIVVEEPAVVEIEPKHDHKPSLIIDPRPIIEKVAEKSVEKTFEKPSGISHHVEEKYTHAEEKHTNIAQQILDDDKEQVLQMQQTHSDVSSEKVYEKHEHHDKSADKSTKPEKHVKASAHMEPKVKEPKAPKTPKAEYNFYELILNHVTAKKLDVISKEKIKKTEYDLVLKNHETNEYIYCKAKDKPSLSEGDLAPAIIFAQSKKMPCLFLSTGKLTKKAELMLGKDFVGLTFEKIVVK